MGAVVDADAEDLLRIVHRGGVFELRLGQKDRRLALNLPQQGQRFVETQAQRLHHGAGDGGVGRTGGDVDHAALRQDAEAVPVRRFHVDQFHGGCSFKNAPRSARGVRLSDSYFAGWGPAALISSGMSGYFFVKLS